MNNPLTRWLMLGEWRAHPLRVLVATGAIALGVALGFAIHLINAAAFNEFSAAIKRISGQADLQVRSAHTFFEESLYAQLAQHEGVETASPVLEIDAAIPGRKNALKVLGIDVLQAAAIAPDLIGIPADDRRFDTLADDAIFLSAAAMEWLQVQQGDTLHLLIGMQTVPLRVAGGLTRTQAGQRLAVMDIAAAQWRLQRLGQLSRIELKLKPGVNRDAFKRELARSLPPHYLVVETADQEARTASMSRAYRVNLNVLALVALFTGGFLVFSTQALSVIRRRGQLALLRVIGMTRTQVLMQVLRECAVLGIAGSLLGLAGGYAAAGLALRLFGGDLGGGYFPGVQPTLQFSPLAALVFFLLGTAVALLGGVVPAWEAASARPAQALKTGSDEAALAKLATPWPALACLAVGALLSQLPPLSGLPVFGYLAIVLLLVGGIALMPRLAAWTFSLLAKIMRSSSVVTTLTLARLANAPNQASIALAGVLSSFSLMVAMAIMVASFRVSVDDWLSHLLSADLYLRTGGGGNTASLSLPQQEALAASPLLQRVEFMRTSSLTLDPARPAVTLIARPIDVADPGKTLPLTENDAPALPADAMPVWASEAMVDLYGYAPGQRVVLPLANGPQEFVVAGIWRDYVRQTGAIQMRLRDYRMLTGDMEASDASLWLQPEVDAEQAIAQLRRLPFGEMLEFSLPGEIRATSLRIFDRSFAVTYLLEAVAIVIGLFGVAATFSAQTLARAKEFGMLRHVGVTRREILSMLAVEGGLLSLLGVIVGFLLGAAISLILVFVVNPQSFHWTMQMHWPWGLLSVVAGVLVAASVMTAVVAGKAAVSGEVVRRVREDW